LNGDSAPWRARNDYISYGRRLPVPPAAGSVKGLAVTTTEALVLTVGVGVELEVTSGVGLDDGVTSGVGVGLGDSAGLHHSLA